MSDRGANTISIFSGFNGAKLLKWTTFNCVDCRVFSKSITHSPCFYGGGVKQHRAHFRVQEASAHQVQSEPENKQFLQRLAARNTGQCDKAFLCVVKRFTFYEANNLIGSFSPSEGFRGICSSENNCHCIISSSQSPDETVMLELSGFPAAGCSFWVFDDSNA